jgi:hypothetical protein
MCLRSDLRHLGVKCTTLSTGSDVRGLWLYARSVQAKPRGRYSSQIHTEGVGACPGESTESVAGSDRAPDGSAGSTRKPSTWTTSVRSAGTRRRPSARASNASEVDPVPVASHLVLCSVNSENTQPHMHGRSRAQHSRSITPHADSSGHLIRLLLNLSWAIFGSKGVAMRIPSRRAGSGHVRQRQINMAADDERSSGPSTASHLTFHACMTSCLNHRIYPLKAVARLESRRATTSG